MMGDIAIAGPTSALLSDALFSGGRFCGFGAARGIEFPPAVSYLWSINERGRPPRFEPASCFSFESDEARGIRVVEHSGEIRLVSDFSFVRERPLLVSAYALSVDADRSLVNKELLHLALPLARHRTVRVCAEYPDGCSMEADLGEIDQVEELFGSRFQIHFGDEVLVIAFLTRSGLPLVSSVGIFRVPELVLGIGGRFSLSPTVGTGTTAEFAMLIGTGSEAVQEIDGLLSGRLPAAIQKELGNGPWAMDPRPTPPAPRELRE